MKNINANKYKLASRASPLALAQANFARNLLLKNFDLNKNMKEAFPITKLTTKGDNLRQIIPPHLADKGIFTKEIENSLLSNDTDIAIHSCKDLSRHPTEGLICGAYLKRENIHDCLITRSDFIHKPNDKFTIGTSSLRRQAQSLIKWENITVLPLRGNINTRLKKLLNKEVDALILAKCGLDRLLAFDNLFLESILPNINITELSVSDFLPAAGQAVIFLQCRENDKNTYALLQKLNNSQSNTEIAIERTFLNYVEADCGQPIAINCCKQKDNISINASLYLLDHKSLKIEDYISHNLSNISCDLKNVEETGIVFAKEFVKKAGTIFMNKFKQISFI